ncbi:MAG TPA: MlaE family lipid ABC transporter permease subunit [Nitrospiraceae bacterium]|nr:MlaE family lipid ABC transporter permease subunit [Nitrospira sp.]HSF67358.1 MlaE family lipid ABC transporter permease subunit [Nitrospiraceae bacterium]
MTIQAKAAVVNSLDTRLSPESGTLTLVVTGRWDSYTTGNWWHRAQQILAQSLPRRLVIDASGVSYCDGAGIAFLVLLQQLQARSGGDAVIRGLHEEFRRLLDIYGRISIEPASGRRAEALSITQHVGKAGIGLWRDVKRLLEFIGELATTMFYAARHPRLVRWRDAWLVAEQAGVNAFPVIALIGLLLGLILAFQSAMSLRRFGADIFVANLIGLAMLREMGPLMTAIILTGRSGSAFAAEIGTMKVREEIDALTTMGLEPVRFLVLPRVLAAVVVTPILTVFAIAFGLFGGGLVMRSLGYPFVAYVNQMLTAVTLADLRGGLVKSLAYGIVVAAIGCLRGLQTTTGASAVGQSTTNAVVSGIVLIAIVDGIFALVYYALGW